MEHATTDHFPIHPNITPSDPSNHNPFFHSSNLPFQGFEASDARQLARGEGEDDGGEGGEGGGDELLVGTINAYWLQRE